MTLIHLPPMRDAEDDLGLGVPNTGRSRWGWSYYGTFRRCRRLWAFAYGPEARPAPPRTGGARGLGTAVHAGIAAWYIDRSGRPTISPSDATDEVCTRLGLSPPQRHRAQEALHAYMRAFADERWEIVSVEQEYEIAFGPEHGGGGDLGDVPFTTRYDLVLRSEKGTIFSLNHKTGFRPDGKTLKAYGMHGGTHGEVWIGRKVWGRAFGGDLLNLISTAPPHTVQRVPVPPAPRMVEAFPRMIRNTALEIQWWLEAAGADPFDHDPLSQENGCRHLYDFCDYADPCSGAR